MRAVIVILGETQEPCKIFPVEWIFLEPVMLPTLPLLENTDFPALKRASLQILQVNLGYLCNQSCLHCHVNAGPKRTELMSREHIDLLLKVLQLRGIKTLDLTGGAPELNPHFRYLVEQARALDVTVMDRCNLTVLQEPGQEDLAEFLAAHQVQIVASLPCYSEANVDGQRGKGVFQRSIEGLKTLNALGYGKAGSRLELNLVYNPGGAYLPPPQQQLEQDYQQQLRQDHGIEFTALFTITNMPIARFGSTLLSKGEFHSYMQLLKDSFSLTAHQNVMCKTLLSIDWQGFVYDCDFNQMLGLGLSTQQSLAQRLHLRDLLDRNSVPGDIIIADHCYGCTAGQGSSCGGALA